MTLLSSLPSRHPRQPYDSGDVQGDSDNWPPGSAPVRLRGNFGGWQRCALFANQERGLTLELQGTADSRDAANNRSRLYIAFLIAFGYEIQGPPGLHRSAANAERTAKSHGTGVHAAGNHRFERPGAARGGTCAADRAPH